MVLEVNLPGLRWMRRSIGEDPDWARGRRTGLQTKRWMRQYVNEEVNAPGT